MRLSGGPRVVICGHRRRVTVRRRTRAVLGSRQPRLQRHARDQRVRCLGVRVPRGGARAGRDDRRTCRCSTATTGETPATARIRSATRAPRSIAVIAAREAWSDAALRIGEPGAGVVIGSGGGGIDVGERQYYDFFVERGKQGDAVRDSDLDRRHGVERDFDFAAAARHQPRAVVRLHELHRRDRLRRGADSLGRGGRAAVRRRRRVRHAGDDLRLLAHAGRVDGVQRRAGRSARGRSTRAATASCSARARGCSCSSARIARGRAARRSTRRSTATARRATRITACRWRRTARRSCARCRWPSSGRAVALEEIGYVNYHGTSTRAERRGRIAVRASRVRRARRSPRGIVGEVDDRPPAGRERRRRRRHGRAGAVARLSAADDQPSRARSGVRSRLHSEPRPRRRRGGRALQLSRLWIEEQRDRPRAGLVIRRKTRHERTNKRRTWRVFVARVRHLLPGRKTCSTF